VLEAPETVPLHHLLPDLGSLNWPGKRQAEMEGRTLALVRRGPKPPSVGLENRAADGEPLLMAFDTGMRKREVLDLRWQQVDLRSGTITLALRTRSPRRRGW